MMLACRKKGFTIIEVLLAMTFLSLLMLMIGYVTLHLVNIYNKGVSIRDVNKTAGQIISDMQLTIANSGNIKCGVKYAHNDRMTVYGTESETCGRLLADDPSDNIAGGAICTGKYSYVWNYGHALQKLADLNLADRKDAEKRLFRYRDESGGYQMVRMARVEDGASAYCSSATNLMSPGANIPVIYSNSSVTNNLSRKDKVVELIETGDRDMALHSFLVSASSPDPLTDQALYEFEFVLGTFRDKVLMTENASCKNLVEGSKRKTRPDGTIDTSEMVDAQDLSYCAINKFNFAARAVKGKGKW